MSHQLKYATIVPAAKPLGESTFAGARKAIESKYSVSPVEVFLDTVQVDGVVSAGDIALDLGELNLRFLVFGADYPADDSQPAQPAAEPADADASATDSTTTTTA